ncbi:MAG: hypothetical protein KF899_06040 [Parvibaculum sp.]|nr:hypothetical protein [Parvibaculum sp.]
MRHTPTFPKEASLVAALGAALLAAGIAMTPAASAQTQALDDDTCARLNAQYNYVSKFKAGLPYADDARAVREEAVENCRAGNTEEGADQLREALRTLLVDPAA